MPFRLSLLGIATAILLTAVPTPATAAPNDVTVMTRNLYLGSDIINLATAPDVPALAQAVKANLELVRANDFTVRSKAIAAEVKRYRPDVIGLQEAAIWRRGPDGVQDNDITKLNSTQVIYDYVDILMKDLRAAGLSYRLVRATTELDIEGPHADGYDVRLTQRDAVLVRTGRGAPRVIRARGGNFSSAFTAPTKIGPARVTRGWAGVDLRKGGRTFSFANTHAEAYSPDIAEAQVKELLRRVGRSRPAIVVGDINSDPGSVGTSDQRGTERLPKAYEAMLDGGFTNPLPRRITSGYGEDLRKNDQSKLDEWLDHIFVRPRARLRVLRSSLTGTRQVNGLWPSDHRGVVATVRVR